MFTPTYRGSPTESTEIRIAYDDDFLYASGRFYDSDPGGIRATSLVRDMNSPSDDIFCLVVDSFDDNENALGFTTSALANRGDFSVYGDAEQRDAPPFNESWNTFWDVAVVRTDQGWFAEMRIPFSSLRFQDDNGKVVMGIIAWRYHPRKNEIVISPDIPPNWVWGFMKPSRAQNYSLDGVFSRNPLYITPYILGGVGHSNAINGDSTVYVRSSNNPREAGLDIKYGLTSNLTLDLTANTDFAQVEADDQQVNLTRFSLFFPEKRLFFQERSSLFAVSMGGPNQLFYSRQIGLSEEGPVRLFGGARLVGRVGNWDLGLINVQTDKSADLPSENFGVLRLRRQVLNENSYIGTLLTSRVGKDGSYNYAYGLDGTIRADDNDYLTVNWAQTFDDETVKHHNARMMDLSRFRISWERRSSVGFSYEASLSRNGLHFEPDMGFAPRVNYTRAGDRLSYGWLGDESSSLQSANISLLGSTTWNNQTKSIESLEAGSECVLSFKSGNSSLFGIRFFQEDIVEAFDLSDEATIPVGRYNYYSVYGFYQTPAGADTRAAITVNLGKLYDGRRFSFIVQPAWNISQFFELASDYNFTRATFESRNETFLSHIGRLRIRANASTQLSSSAFVQFSNTERALTLNMRIRYNPREGNDFFIVYNEGLNTEGEKGLPFPPQTRDRTLLLKYSYTFVL